MENFEAYLKTMVAQEGSDLYLTTGATPSMKVHGAMQPLSDSVNDKGEVRAFADSIMTEQQRTEFEKTLEMNLALSRSQIGRFRVNIFQQRNEVSMVIRHIKTEIPSFTDLNLPNVLSELIMTKRGLILFVGATGSGKSTSIASLIDHRNANSSGHIITIEDPIEFLYKHKKSIVNQREVGIDTLSYEEALKNTLRQAPDVIAIGEIRAQDTMEHAINFAETGHLCVSTLHANNANQAFDRIINFFPEERHPQLLLDLSLNVRGVISQRLIPTVDGKRVAAIEILIGTPLISDMIKRGDIATIKEVMEKSESQGMQTFDMSLFNLLQQGVITEEEAIKNADSPNNLRLRINLKDGVKQDASSQPLSIQMDDDKTD